MKWQELSDQTKLECLQYYRNNRQLSAITPLAQSFNMLPQTLLRRLQQLDRDYEAPDYEDGEEFPDKKIVYSGYKDVLQQIKTTQQYKQEKSVSQDEATWFPRRLYPNLPIAITWMSDVHFGSLEVDYELFERHLELIINTPNMFIIFGGDEIDNFNAVKYPDGIWHDGVSPEDQMKAWAELLSRLDEQSKLGAIVWGNHTEFSSAAGINPYSAFFSEVSCPLFVDGGGVLNIILNNIKYRIGIRHTFWGGSKLNITNSPKRMIQFGYPNLDAAFVGHTHNAGGEMFTLEGQEKIAVTGGTYKTKDTFKKRWDGDPHEAGFTILLYPNEKQMLLTRYPEQARDMILGQIALQSQLDV